MPDPGLSYVDEDEAITDRRIEYAKNTRGRSNRNTDTVWRKARNRTEAVDAANARWSELAAAQRTASTSFSDDPRQVLYLVEYETTKYSNTGEKIADLYRGADPPNTVDRSHAAHYIPRPGGWESGTRDRIRPARAGVERLPVLTPRADRELAVRWARP